MRPDQKRDVIGPTELAHALCVVPRTISGFLALCRTPAVPEMATYIQGAVAKDYGTKAVEVAFLNRFQARCCALYVALVRDGMGEASAAANAWLALCGWGEKLPEVVFVRSGNGVGGMVRLVEPPEWEVGFRPLELDKVEQRLAYSFGVWGKTLGEWLATGEYHGIRLLRPERPELPESVREAAKRHGTKQEKAAARAMLSGITTVYGKPRRTARVVELPDDGEQEGEAGAAWERPELAPDLAA